MPDEPSDQPMEADARIAAESLALRRSPLDPLRAVAAAECAGFRGQPDERVALGALLERLDADETATLAGSAEGRERLATLAAADAIAGGEKRVLWVGPRPRALDRLCERCDRRLIEVRNERGAYAGSGVFWLADLATAPPGLGGADPFGRVVHVGPHVADAPWRGPTLWVTDDDDAIEAPPLELAPVMELRTRPTPGAEAVDALLREPLLSLDPALGPLARAACGTNADRRAVLGRLITRLGRMSRAARADRTDDGSETARQLASDHDGVGDVLLAEALEATSTAAPSADELEAERERLGALDAALEPEHDPILELLDARARASLTAGSGVALVLPGRASREAMTQRLADVIAEDPSVDERLEQARQRPAVAIVSVGEHRDERLDRVAYAGLRVIATGVPIAEATETVGEGDPASPVRTTDAPRSEPDADEMLWSCWRATLDLEAPSVHPDAREAIHRALELSPAPWSLGHLRRAEGDALLIVGPARSEEEPAYDTFEEAGFRAELAFLRVARRRLERSLATARTEWRDARDRLVAKRRVAESAIEDARRRKERALGDQARQEASEAQQDAESALDPLDEEARTLADAHEAARCSALARFAEPGVLDRAADRGSASASHPSARLAR